MTKKVLDVGNCQPDHGAIRRLIEGSFAAEVVQAHSIEEAVRALGEGSYDLVLVNRILDRDGSSGLDVIRTITSSPDFKGIPLMMITNFAEHQTAAITAGAVQGFGKASLMTPETLKLLGQYLASES